MRDLLSLCQLECFHMMAMRLVPFLAAVLVADLKEGRCVVTSSAQQHCDARAVLLTLLQAASAAGVSRQGT